MNRLKKAIKISLIAMLIAITSIQIYNIHPVNATDPSDVIAGNIDYEGNYADDETHKNKTTNTSSKWYATYGKGTGYKGQGVLIYMLTKDGNAVSGVTPKAFPCDSKAFSTDLVARDKYGKYGEVTTWESSYVRWACDNNGDCKKNGKNKPYTFDFLGFTHYCSKSYKTGKFRVKRKTSKKKFKAKVQEYKVWIKTNRNKPLSEIMEITKKKLIGHYNYYGITDNLEAISNYAYQVRKLLMKWLNRRSQKKSYNYDEYIEEEIIPGLLQEYIYADYVTASSKYKGQFSNQYAMKLEVLKVARDTTKENGNWSTSLVKDLRAVTARSLKANAAKEINFSNDYSFVTFNSDNDMIIFESAANGLTYNEKFDKQLIKTILGLLRDNLDTSKEESLWFADMKAIALDNKFAPNGKTLKQNQDTYIGTVGDVAEMLRISLTTRRNSPNLYYVMKVLGKEELLNRI